jgi:hypothetical protein
MKILNKTWIWTVGLIASAVVWRVASWQYGWAANLEIVTASVLVASTFLTRRAAVVVPLGILAVSDLIIGNSPILIFTWSAFGLIALGGLGLRRLKGSKGSPARLILAATGAGVASSVFFFAYTNFGVWLLDGGRMYAQTWQGLVHCYVMGLPFYRTMLLGNLVFVPMYFAVALYGPGLLPNIGRYLKRPQTGSAPGRP